MGQSVGGIGVIDKAVELLDIIAAGPRTLTELTQATGVPRATCHRLAVTLERHGVVRRDDLGRFCIGLRMVSWAASLDATLAVREVARLALEDLRDSTGESVQLYVRDADERVCVLSLESPNELRTIVAEGARLPLERGSAGKVLGDDWSGRAKFAASVGERQAGVASVSAPVHARNGAVVAAVSLSGPIERLGRDPGRRYATLVAKAAGAIERRL